jgi:predicted nucleic acid-binding protein
VAGGADAVLALLAADVLRIEFRIESEFEPVRGLMRKFRSVPMSFADACLVRMTELEPRSTVLTFDSDFRVYRRNRRQTVPSLMPG